MIYAIEFYYPTLWHIGIDALYPYLLQAGVSGAPWDSTISEPVKSISDAKPLFRFNNGIITKHDGKTSMGIFEIVLKNKINQFEKSVNIPGLN